MTDKYLEKKLAIIYAYIASTGVNGYMQGQLGREQFSDACVRLAEKEINKIILQIKNYYSKK